jgi:hypothetical protein
MEIYVMKKKFVLTLALVLMVAGTLVAATPLEVSGSFKAGYDYTFAATNSATAAYGNEANVTFAFSGDFWDLEIGGDVLYGEEKGLSDATAKIYLDKALAEKGVDLEDISLTLHAGTGVSADATSVFADEGELSSGLSGAGVSNVGITLGYADLFEVYASVEPISKSLPMVVGVKFMPVDGVDAAVGYTNNGNGIIVSAAADVASLVGLEDISLAASVEDIYMIDAETNELNIDVATEVSGIGLWAAYQLAGSAHAAKAEASYSTTVSDFDLSAAFAVGMPDVTDIDAWTYKVSGGAEYVMGGVTYALDAAYQIDAETFTLSPSVSISF